MPFGIGGALKKAGKLAGKTALKVGAGAATGGATVLAGELQKALDKGEQVSNEVLQRALLEINTAHEEVLDKHNNMIHHHELVIEDLRERLEQLEAPKDKESKGYTGMQPMQGDTPH